jgi:hypothetical protein
MSRLDIRGQDGDGAAPQLVAAFAGCDEHQVRPARELLDSPDSSRSRERLAFTSEAIENMPVGWQVRVTYTFHAPDVVEEVCELAEWGKPFALYSRARLGRIAVHTSMTTDVQRSGSSGSRMRELWRMRRGDRLLTAVLYWRGPGIELRIEPQPAEGPAAVVHSRLEVSNIAALELDGEGVRHRLRDSGWVDIVT